MLVHKMIVIMQKGFDNRINQIVRKISCILSRPRKFICLITGISQDFCRSYHPIERHGRMNMRIGIKRVFRRIHLLPNTDNMHGIGPISLIAGYIIHQRLCIGFQTIIYKFRFKALTVKRINGRLRRICGTLIAGCNRFRSGIRYSHCLVIGVPRFFLRLYLRSHRFQCGFG